MRQERTKGLLAIWADSDEDYRAEFEKWHQCEHTAERVTIAKKHVEWVFGSSHAESF